MIEYCFIESTDYNQKKKLLIEENILDENIISISKKEVEKIFNG